MGHNLSLSLGDVAQLGERCRRMAEAEGSTPFISTTSIVSGPVSSGPVLYSAPVAPPGSWLNVAASVDAEAL